MQNRFLLPAILLRQILSEPTLGEMRDSLQSLPAGLQDAFDATFERIRTQTSSRMRIGISTVTWIREAKRPLEIKELRELFAIRPESPAFDRSYSPEQHIILEACMGLVTVDPATKIVQFVHFAVFEYLDEHADRLFPWQPLGLGTLLLKFFCSEIFTEGALQDEASIVQQLRKYKLISYASLFWNKHVQDKNDIEMSKILIRFLDTPASYQPMIQFHQYCTGFRETYWCFEETRSRTAVHLACHFGLVDRLQKLIQEGADLNSSTAVCRTRPILNAAANENPDVLRTLLVDGPRLDVSNWYGTALHCAAERGRIENVVTLLEAGLLVDLQEENFGRTSLHCAVQEEYWAVAQLLLDHGANPNARDHKGRSPVHFVTCGSNRYSTMLLEAPRKMIRTLRSYG